FRRGGRPLDEAAQGVGDRLDRSEGVVQLVGKHANQSPPSLALFLAQGARHICEYQELVRQAALAERAATHFPTSLPTWERQVDHARRLAAERLGEPQLGGTFAEQLLGGAAQQRRAGPVP